MLTEHSGICLRNPYLASPPRASVSQLEDGRIGCFGLSMSQASSGSRFGSKCLLPVDGSDSGLFSSLMSYTVQAEEEQEALLRPGEAGGLVEASQW